MIASVHFANLRKPSALAMLRRAPRPSANPGLRSASIGFAAPLSSSILPAPDLGRVGIVAFWEDDAAIDQFLADSPIAAALAGGFHLRLEPLRATGTWPGLPVDLPNDRAVEVDGPAAVLTLGRLRLSQAPRFFRASAKPEGRAAAAPGLIWGSGLGRPPFVATCSLWESSRALMTYAYGHREPEHSDAIAQGEAKAFHHQSAFIRFRPYGASGSLTGRNPLAAGALAVG
jgi:hypothetical protein